MQKKALFVGLLAVLAWSSLGMAQSLADVARAEEARRKAVRRPAKVYTNDDLKGAGVQDSTPPVPDQPANAVPAAGAGPVGANAGATPKPSQPAAKASDAKASDAKASDAKASDAKKDEKYWRDRIASIRDALTQDKVLQAALQSRINALNTDFVNTSDPAQRSVVDGNRRTALAELDRMSKDIDKQTKAITDIQEEARKASVPAGWLR
jgi:hypothetical protein